MTEKTKGRTERHDPKKNDYRNCTADDPVMGWYALAKPARMGCKQKRIWRRKSGGAISGDLLALLILAIVVGLLLAGVAL